MSRLTRKRLLLGKAETTYGTDAVPTLAANGIVCGDITLNGIEATFNKRKIVKPYLGSPGSIKGVTKSSVKFGVEAAGSGAAGTAPAFGELLRACGLSETINAATSVVYAPVSDAFESVTIYGNDDGVQYKLLGVRGTVDLQMTVGDAPILSFDMTGLYGGAPTAVTTPTGTMPTYVLPVSVGGDNSSLITLGGSTYPWQSCNISLSNTVNHTPLAGFEEVVISDRGPMAKVVLQATAAEEIALMALVDSGTEQVFQVTHGTTAGNIIQADGPKFRLTNPQRQDVNGIMLLGFDLEAIPNAGNDELTLTFK